VRVRLDPKTDALVRSPARRTGQSKSRAYETWKDVIGLAHAGPADLSERTGEKVRARLLARHPR
jgi:hypothetical protein